MKLVEIKNSLAKLYYEPAVNQLVLSDFLTVDDGNKKILSQVISIESTSKSDTNCAILKFSLDIDDSGNFSIYSGYVPSLDASLSITDGEVLKNIFSNNAKTVNLGELSNTSGIHLNLNASILDNFLYIQSDLPENTHIVLSKILDCNNVNSRKTLFIDFDNLSEYSGASVLELGKEFKLPIGTETINYIYENDLTGLTVEQKAIVQDILLEIQDYISTLDSGYIPFNTFLDVVNGVYETDKSAGVILLRNKLLKYKQFGIFASNDDEISSLNAALDSNTLTVLNLSKITPNWQKETVDFVINNLQGDYCFIMQVNDENVDKDVLNKIYKSQNINPVILSSYDCAFAHQLKSFARNLILYKPLEQQKSFATYNSFLTKLSQKEFIVSGEGTYYTPLIIKEMPDNIQLCNNLKQETKIDTTDDRNELQTEEDTILEPEVFSAEENLPDEDMMLLDTGDELLPMDELPQIEDESNEIKNIFDESLENEIAKDVDDMFFSSTQEEEVQTEQVNSEVLQDSDEQSGLDDLLSESDLDVLDDINEQVQPVESTEEEGVSGLLLLEDKPVEESKEDFILNNDDSIQLESDLEELPLSDDLPELPDAEDFIVESSVMEDSSSNIDVPTGVPVYSAEPEESVSDDSIKISEGNIVYHERFGRGVVEELFNYGKRTLCSIQFDNHGRRLMDPNLAELKQM